MLHALPTINAEHVYSLVEIAQLLIEGIPCPKSLRSLLRREDATP
jgi:hypothetical protein